MTTDNGDPVKISEIGRYPMKTVAAETLRYAVVGLVRRSHRCAGQRTRGEEGLVPDTT